jgi:hypothetical protein
MLHNATFNNISVISWRPVLLAEETGVRFFVVQYIDSFGPFTTLSWIAWI